MTRSRRSEDLQRCVGLLRAVRESDRYPANRPSHPADWVAGRRTIAAWVSEEDDELVGHLALTAADPARAWPEWEKALGVSAERIAVVSRFFVAPNQRNGGIGTRLMDCAHAEAARRGLHLALDVANHNHPAIAFYENRGWLRVGEGNLPPGDEGHALRVVLFVEPGNSRPPY